MGVTQGMHHIIFTAPSGVPLNVTVEVESSTRILISWQPPEELKQNGNITSYKVQINSTVPSIQPHSRYLSTDNTSISVTGNLQWLYT